MKTSRAPLADTRVVASFRKNTTQEVRVAIVDRGDFSLVDLRVHEATPRSAGEPQPTRAGICIVRSKLPELIRALQVAEKAA